MVPISWHMVMESSLYLGFVDASIHHTWNLDSTAWVIYVCGGHIVFLGGVFLWPSLNNVAKYSAIIELLRDSI